MTFRTLRFAALGNVVLWLATSGCGLKAQDAVVRRVATVTMPQEIDSNSPAFWHDGRLFWFGSNGGPWLSSGPSQFGPWETKTVPLETPNAFPHWVESVAPEDNGLLYGWYHAEPIGLLPDSILTAPKIGAFVSTDGGATLHDIGIVLESGEPLNPAAQNGYFAGGHGDGNVLHDRERRYFYFFFGNYGGATETQGVCVARMAYEDRANPVGKVWKYHNGAWLEAGRGGRVTPIFPVRRPWGLRDPDAFWGPSVHWNTYLNCYVMLLNHALGEPGWSQEGVYISFNSDLSRPEAWTTPRKILDKSEFPGWYFFYPQVMGLESGGSDRRAGQVARLYVGGISKWEIEFIPPAIAPTALQVEVTPAPTVATGAPVAFSVTAVGQTPFTYQWLKDGAVIPQATAATYVVPAATAGDAGGYAVIVANSLGTATSNSVLLTVNPPTETPKPQPAAYLSNLSIYAYVGDEPAALTIGYSVRAEGTKPLVLRAIGPTLANLGVPDGASNPKLEVFDGAGRLIAANDDWRPADAAVFAAAGAFPLPEGSADAGLALAVSSGTGTARAYTAGAGHMLIEIYDPAPAANSKLSNASARARVGNGAQQMVVGVSVGGSGSKRLLVRALGPQLAAFGVPEPLTDPVLDVFSQGGLKITENSQWLQALDPVFAEAGASPLPAGSRDAALIMRVVAGQGYTFVVHSGDGTEGEAMLEIFELP